MQDNLVAIVRGNTTVMLSSVKQYLKNDKWTEFLL